MQEIQGLLMKELFIKGLYWREQLTNAGESRFSPRVLDGRELVPHCFTMPNLAPIIQEHEREETHVRAPQNSQEATWDWYPKAICGMHTHYSYSLQKAGFLMKGETKPGVIQWCSVWVSCVNP